MTTFRRLLLCTVAMLALPAALRGQAPITAADLSRLETSAAEVEQLAGTLKKTDPTLAASVSETLVEVKDEIAYLRVKLRKEGRVSREEYAAVRDRIETLRVRAQGQRVAALPVIADDPGAAAAVIVPVGAELDVRLQSSLSSETAKVEERFEATSLVDYVAGTRVVIPAGSIVRGFVSSVRPSTKIDRRGSMTLSFDELRIDSRTMRLRASVLQALDPKMGQDISRIGAGAVVGGIVGGLLGGGKGALIGVLVGGGGTLAATDGSDVELPLGTVLRIRVDQPLEIIVR